MMLRSRMAIMTIALIGAIMVALSYAFFMFYAQANGFRSQIDALDTEKSQLESQVNNLQVQNAGLQNQIAHLEAESAQLQNRVDSAETENAQMRNQVDQLERARDYLLDILLEGFRGKSSLFGYITPE